VSTCTVAYVPGKSVSHVSCSCRLKCTDKFSFDDKQSFIKSVYDGLPKNEQDSFLMGLIIRKDPVRKRSNSEEPRKRAKIF
jgi:hypothetical protein